MSWSFICCFCWSLSDQFCLGKKISPDLGVGGSWSGNAVGGCFGVFFLLFWAHPFFQSVQHLGLKSCVSCVSTRRPYVTAARRDPSSGSSASRSLRKGESGASPCVRRVRSPRGQRAGGLCREDEWGVLRSTPRDPSPLIYNIKL